MLICTQILRPFTLSEGLGEPKLHFRNRSLHVQNSDHKMKYYISIYQKHALVFSFGRNRIEHVVVFLRTWKDKTTIKAENGFQLKQVIQSKV